MEPKWKSILCVSGGINDNLHVFHYNGTEWVHSGDPIKLGHTEEARHSYYFDDPFKVIGQHMKAHFGADPVKDLGQEMRIAHPGF